MTRRSADAVKRCVDLLFAVALLILTAPVQAVVALLVRLRLGSPVLFRQQRPGRHGTIFTLVKFRTMLVTDGHADPREDACRLTPLGAKLRASSLDELPTLWNVVRGDMSLVGPRPLLVEYLDLYTPSQARRHEVRPGITGLAQVSGRNSITWEQKFAADLQYVDERSLRLDLTILARTVVAVIRRTGVSAGAEVTMPPFEGTTDA